MFSVGHLVEFQLPLPSLPFQRGSPLQAVMGVPYSQGLTTSVEDFRSSMKSWLAVVSFLKIQHGYTTPIFFVQSDESKFVPRVLFSRYFVFVYSTDNFFSLVLGLTASTLLTVM